MSVLDTVLFQTGPSMFPSLYKSQLMIPFGQLTSYAAARLGTHSFGRFFFFFHFCRTGQCKALLRWDRSAIVTEAIKYYECDALTEFLFRHSKAPAAVRGKVESVSGTSSAREALKLDSAVSSQTFSIPDATGVPFLCHMCPRSNTNSLQSPHLSEVE